MKQVLADGYDFSLLIEKRKNIYSVMLV